MSKIKRNFKVLKAISTSVLSSTIFGSCSTVGTEFTYYTVDNGFSETYDLTLACGKTLKAIWNKNFGMWEVYYPTDLLENSCKPICYFDTEDIIAYNALKISEITRLVSQFKLPTNVYYTLINFYNYPTSCSNSVASHVSALESLHHMLSQNSTSIAELYKGYVSHALHTFRPIQQIDYNICANK